MSLLNQGYNQFAAITPSDTVNIEPPFPVNGAQGYPTDAIYVGTKGSTGTVVGVLPSGATVTLIGLLAGTIYPIRVIRVNTTTTDASNLVACYIR